MILPDLNWWLYFASAHVRAYMGNPMRSKFRNRLFDVKYLNLKDYHGFCTDEKDERLIEISDRLKGKMRLDAEIHEVLHACFPTLAEEDVEVVATDITRFLWKTGYRLKL